MKCVHHFASVYLTLHVPYVRSEVNIRIYYCALCYCVWYVRVRPPLVFSVIQ